MNLQARCRELIAQGLTLAEIARALGIKYGRVKVWNHRWKKRGVTISTKVSVTIAPAWMRSLSHDWAHLVNSDGVGVCGARVPMGGAAWHPAEETKRCPRCQGVESNNAGKKKHRYPKNRTMSKLDEALKRRGLSYRRA